MKLSAWFDKVIKRYHWQDIALIKLSVAAFVLMLAKLWTPLLDVPWYVYAVIAVLAAWVPLKKVFVDDKK